MNLILENIYFGAYIRARNVAIEDSQQGRSHGQVDARNSMMRGCLTCVDYQPM